MCVEDPFLQIQSQILLQHYRRQRCQTPDHDDDEDDDDDDTTDETSSTALVNQSMWGEAITRLKCTLKSQPTVLYLDFVWDVEDVTEFLNRDGVKAGKYTGKMKVEDCEKAEKNFIQGDTKVLVATESYELGVDNPNLNQVIRIGCPCNLGVLLQEFGRAGRRPNTDTSGLLEVQDDKRLGLWLKSALKESNATLMSMKQNLS